MCGYKIETGPGVSYAAYLSLRHIFIVGYMKSTQKEKNDDRSIILEINEIRTA